MFKRSAVLSLEFVKHAMLGLKAGVSKISVMDQRENILMPYLLYNWKCVFLDPLYLLFLNLDRTITNMGVWFLSRYLIRQGVQ